LWQDGIACYAGVVIVANIKMFTSTNNHSVFSFLLQFLSVAVFFVVFYVESIFPGNDLFGTFIPLMIEPDFWIGVALIIITIMLSEKGLHHLRMLFLAQLDASEKKSNKEKEREDKKLMKQALGTFVKRTITKRKN
jgi:hypothetical protein